MGVVGVVVVLVVVVLVVVVVVAVVVVVVVVAVVVVVVAVVVGVGPMSFCVGRMRCLPCASEYFQSQMHCSNPHLSDRLGPRGSGPNTHRRLTGAFFLFPWLCVALPLVPHFVRSHLPIPGFVTEVCFI